jgi:hypothetical protein
MRRPEKLVGSQPPNLSIDQRGTALTLLLGDHSGALGTVGIKPKVTTFRALPSPYPSIGALFFAS